MSDQVTLPLRALHDDLQSAAPALLRLSDEALQRTAPWRGRDVPLRIILLRLADDAFTLLGAVREMLRREGFVQTEAQGILGAGGAANGRLLGLLTALTPEEFEAEPPGGWSPRRIAGHVVANDRRYTIQTRHSVNRGRDSGAGPMRPPDASLPPSDGLAESGGTVTELLVRVFEAREAAAAALAGIEDSDLGYETNWMLWNADVRFRLNRFSDHDREHYAHLRKTLAAIGVRPTDPRLAIEETCALHGAVAGSLLGLDERTPAAAAVAPLLEQGVQQQAALLGTLGAS